MFDNITLLFRLFYEPSAAMSAILDEGSLLFASLAVLAVSLTLPAWLPFSFYTPLLLLAVVYVPGALVTTMLLARLGAFSTVFERDYSPLLTCTSMAWAAANIPLVLAARVASPSALVPVAALAYLYFAVLMFFAIRTVFGTENGIAAGVVCLSWIPLVGALLVWGPIRAMAGWLASPFFLFYAYRYLGGEFSNLGAGLRSRQNFHRMLEAAAVNPHDAEARYQLGLIYQQRRQYSEAIRQFKSAVEIDPKETDAHFQLGRIALEQGRLKDAFASLQTVLDLDEKHSSSEILRELGRMYLAAKQYEDARRELEMYVERRPYDPEGLYYYGQAREQLGDAAGAREAYGRAVESARSTPRFRRPHTAKWSRLAQKQLGKLR
jgi:tetratricopeptide (TPR) repeat protein